MVSLQSSRGQHAPPAMGPAAPLCAQAAGSERLQRCWWENKDHAYPPISIPDGGCGVIGVNVGEPIKAKILQAKVCNFRSKFWSQSLGWLLQTTSSQRSWHSSSAYPRTTWDGCLLC